MINIEIVNSRLEYAARNSDIVGILQIPFAYKIHGTTSAHAIKNAHIKKRWYEWNVT